MRQKRKNKVRRQILLITLAVALFMSFLSWAGVSLVRHVKQEYERKLLENQQMIQLHTRLVYVAIRDIKTGETICEEMLEARRSLCSQEEALLFSKDDIGKVAVTDISAGTYLNKSLVNQSGEVKGLREMGYRLIELTGNISDCDVVDVRIRYPDGEDYVVLSDKKIRLEEGDARCYLRVTEEELLLMSAAMVAVEENDGTYLYASKYIVPAIQEKSVVTYQPNKEVFDVMQKSPNVGLDMVSAEIDVWTNGKDE